MYNGKHTKRNGKATAKKSAALVAALTLLVIAIVVGSIAYLTDKTPPVKNIFNSARVPVSIQESFNGTTKSSVKVTNDGNVDAYIRVAAVGNTLDAAGNVTGSFTVNVPTNWTALGEYYYYNGTVAPGESVELLSDGSITVGEGQQVIILASSVQATSAAASDAWKHSFDGTEWN